MIRSPFAWFTRAGWVVLLGLCAGLIIIGPAAAQDESPSADSVPRVGQAVPAASSPEALAAFSRAATYQNNRAFDLAAESWAQLLANHADDPKAVDAEYNLGVCYLELKQFAKARNALQKALTRGPDFARREDALLNLGWAIYTLALQDQADLFAKAERVFAKLLADFPQGKYRDQALFLRGESLYMQGNRVDAVKAYQQLVSEHVDSDLLPNGLYALGVTYEELGEHKKSGDVYDRFLEGFADNALAAEVEMRRAETLLQQGEVSDAEVLFAAVGAIKGFSQADHARYRQAYCVAQQGRFGEAAELFAAILHDFPESRYRDDATMATARAYFRAEKNDQAAHWFDRLLDTDGPAATEAAHWRAQLLLKDGQAEAALQLVDRFLPMAKASSHSFLFQLRMDQADATYELSDRRRQAIQLYLQLVGDSPKHLLAPQALYNAAFGALQLKDYAEALRLTQKFTADYTGHRLAPDVKRVAAESQLQLGDAALAATAFEELARDNTDALESSRLQLRSAVALYTQGEYQAMLAQLTPSLESFKTHDQQAESHYLIGMAQLGLEQFDQARDSLARSLKAQPNWRQADEALLSLSRAEHRRGKTTESKSLVQRLLRDFPDSTVRDEATYRSGEYAYALEQYDEAVRDYRQVVRQWPDSTFVPFSLYGWGWSALRQANYDQAQQAFTRLVSKYPSHSLAKSALYARALAQQQAGQFAAALKDLDAFLLYEVDRREKSDAQYVRGLCYVGLEKYDEAVKTLRAIIQEDEGYERGDKVLYELAWAQKSHDQSQPALAAFQQLATRYPQSSFSAEALYHLGEAQYEQEDYDAAIQMYTDARERSGDQRDLTEKIQYKMGWSLYKAGKYDEAMVAFHDQLQIAPMGDLGGDALFMQGECQFKQRKYQDALPFYDQARGRKLSSEQITTLAYLHAGQAAAQLQRWNDSHGYLAEVAKKYPESPLLHQIGYELAIAQQNLGDITEAERVFGSIADRAHGELAARSRFMLGELLYAKNDHVQAIREFRKVMFGFDPILDGEVVPWQAKAGFEAGQCAGILASQQSTRASRQQYLELATRFFQYVRTRHPDSDEAIAATEQLKKFGVLGR